jgi:hypothetical protein
MTTQYLCKNERRRAIVRDLTPPELNGIDYLEVDPGDQKTLVIHFLHPLPGQPGAVPPAPAPELTRHNFVIEGGVRVTNIRSLEPVLAADKVLTLQVNAAGDFSDYRLRLVATSGSEVAPDGFDPQLAEVVFNFKLDCPSDFDCLPGEEPAPEPLPEPVLDYLSKDYASFRRLMLDRLAVVLPDWKERNPADVGVALVETLAYAADQLSYYQDAVASEAYLGTARKRLSVRRHARLLDYPMHDGCNARAWVQIQVNQDNVSLPAGTPLLTRVQGFEKRLDPASQAFTQAMIQKPEVFETLHAAQLFSAHNEIKFYSWGDADCSLPRGATRATLLGNLVNLKAGDVLVFEEVGGPHSGLPADADPGHRQSVRLTRVTPTSDPLGGRFLNPPVSSPLAVTEIEWHVEDALTFSLFISSRSGTAFYTDLSLARGNMLLADHGRTIQDELLDPDVVPMGAVYRPTLTRSGITQRVPYDHEMSLTRPAMDALGQDPRSAQPAVELQQGSETWQAQRDLLGSDRFAAEFVVEIENDGSARLRFGDNVHGRKPAGGARLQPVYRIGVGERGNIGADSLYHVVTADSRIIGTRNPLAALGGTEPEAIEQVRLYAPHAFHTQERAVTEADYAEVTQRHPDVQKAVATLRWTGSWHTVYVTVDRKGGRPVSEGFEADLRQFLEKYRLAGHDLEVDAPRYVPLDFALTVCLQPGYVRSAVKQALLERFSSTDLPSRGRGFFHPDNLTFGQTIYLSQLVAAAMELPGVEWVDAIRFQRWGQADHGELADGRIVLGRLEIARLDNDPSRPENGRLELNMEGGL